MSYDNRNTGALFQTSNSDQLEGPFTLTDGGKGTALASRESADSPDIDVTIIDSDATIIAEGTMSPYHNDKPGSPTHKGELSNGTRYVLFNAIVKSTGKRFKQIKPDTTGEVLDLGSGW